MVGSPAFGEVGQPEDPASGEAGQLDWFLEWASKNQIFLNSLRLRVFVRNKKDRHRCRSFYFLELEVSFLYTDPSSILLEDEGIG